MQDSSAFLNLPGLKYLQKDSSVDWSEDSSSYLSFSGLKRMDRGQPFTDSSKEFLSKEGLDYLVLSRLSKVANAKVREHFEEIWKEDSSVWFDYDACTGEVFVFWREGNDSIYTEQDNPAVIQQNGNLSLLVYEGRGLDIPMWIEDTGEVKIVPKQ